MATTNDNSLVRKGILRYFYNRLIHNINYLSGKKVDKVDGKGLSTNDFTTAYKNKLDGISEGANKYVLPTASSTILGGIKTGYQTQGKVYPLQVDSSGNGYVSVPWTDNDTTYNVVSTSVNGLAPMLPTENADKKFLNGEGEWVERTKITCTYASSGETFDKNNNSGLLYYIPFNGDNPKTIMGIVTIKSTYFVNDVIGTITLMPVSQANVLIYYGNEIVGTNLINIEVKITELEDGLQVYIKFNYNVNSTDADTFEVDFTEIRGFNYVPYANVVLGGYPGETGP